MPVNSFGSCGFENQFSITKKDHAVSNLSKNPALLNPSVIVLLETIVMAHQLEGLFLVHQSGVQGYSRRHDEEVP